MNKKGTRALASATVVGLVLSTISTGNVQAAPGKVDRLGGGNRYETAAKVAKSNWDKAENVILVNGNALPDALSASLLADKLDAPILLTGKDELNKETSDLLKDLGAKNVYILGSHGVVSEKVEKELKASGKNVKRLAGNTRYKTNIEIAKELIKKGGVSKEEVLVVNGTNRHLVDALTAGPVSANEGKILLLVGDDAESAKEAKDFIKANGIKKVTAIGNTATISDEVYKEVGATKRVSGGANRFETNLEILKAYGLKGQKLYIANGEEGHLVDSLVASALKSPIVLVSTSDKAANEKAIEYIKKNANEKTDLNAVGSKAIVSDDIVGKVNDAVKVETLKIDSVKAITDTKLSVKLSKAVDEAKTGNFSIEGLTINSATLDASKTEVILDVTGTKVNSEYTVKATGLKVNGKVMDDVTSKFTMPKAESLFTPEVTMKDTVLKANGQSSTLVTFALKDAKGNIMKNADKVEVGFKTTFGSFAEQRVTVQNGIATILLTSETLDSAKTATITATVLDAANKNLIGLEAKRDLLMDPNPEDKADEKIGATMTEVQAAQADRVIVYFNKDVSVEKYAKAGTHEYDASKLEANVTSNGAKVDVVGLLPVQDNSKALQLVLKDALTDNADVKVEATDKTGSLPVPSTKECKLTDARKPAMLSVGRDGLKTLKITFSEPVQKADAEKPENWIIDGLALGNDAYLAKAEVGTFNAKTGEDTRNVVTITLGKDAKGQRYFKSGTHSIQGANIGDWAEATDKGNNVMNTQTLDFDIPVDNTAPNAKVEVQSPEQYIVTFDKELNEDEAAIKAAIKLEKFNKDTDKWEEETNQKIKVTPITVDKVKQYKVEVEKDWTVIYDTKGSTRNYYNDNYRLVVAKDAVSSAVNGAKNAKIELLLEGAMKTPDVASPVINTIVENLDAAKKPTGTYTVTMSEPVAFPGVDETKAQEQASIPTPTAEFIKKDGSKTITAKVEKGADAYDKELKVTPASTLEAGEWTVVVRSISDDIGNTAASATKDFTVKAGEAAKADKFAVVWSFADTDTDLDVKTATKDNGNDYVYVKFNKPVSITGDAKSALKTSNYQLNGMPLPTGTQIKANIKGLDDVDKVTDSVTIVLPEGHLKDKNTPHVLTISSYLESTTAGDVLTNGGAKTLTWTADLATVFEKEFAAEQAVYKAEELAKKDLTQAGDLKAAQDQLALAKTAIEAKAVIGKDAKGANIEESFINHTAAKTSLTARFKAVEKTVTDAKAVADAAADKAAVKTATDAVVKAEGTKSQTDVDAASNLVKALKDGADKTALQDRIKAIKVVAPAPATKVTLEAGSVVGAAADNGKITGLTKGTSYVVTVGGKYHGVKADGTLGAEKTDIADAKKDAVALTVTEITGLTNGTSYKVETV